MAQIWVRGEPKVRHYATPEGALLGLAALSREGREARAFYAQDRQSGIKLLATQAWFVRDASKRLDAFLLRGDAEAHAARNGGEVIDFATARSGGGAQLSAR